MSRLLISAAHKSSGKTTISVGLGAALQRRGMIVQPFKKGPDYIDPMWLSAACGRPCYNLDPYLMAHGEIAALFGRHAATADISLVEGNKGLYDGLALDGSNSNAALAHLLDLPVVLVIDARGMTRGVAPLILGYQAFDTKVRIAGVILNNLGGSRHEEKMRAVIEHYTDVPVLGAVQNDPKLGLIERHLGLTPGRELDDERQRITIIASMIADQVDLDRLVVAAANVTALAPQAAPAIIANKQERQVRIGIARDKAFGFYYADDLDAFSAVGAELVPFDTLTDQRLPPVDGVFIGGGFPEVFLGELEANISLREDIRLAVDGGMPVYAECGGLMYLANTLSWQGRTAQMVGALQGDVVMRDKPVGRGYVRLRETSDALWQHADSQTAGESADLYAHEFHYSTLENLSSEVKFAYGVQRGHGVDGKHDGIIFRNVLASYSHLRNSRSNNWVARFVAFVRHNIRSQAEQATDTQATVRAVTADKHTTGAIDGSRLGD